MQDMRLRVEHQHVAHTIPSSLGRRPIHALPQISIGYVFLSLSPYTNISIFVFNVRTYGCTAKNPPRKSKPGNRTIVCFCSCNDDANIVKHHPHQVPLSPSSEEDNSVTEMNNCRRLLDKPPLVRFLKRNSLSI